MQLPFFSILIPVYNVEKYLPECLESVVNQTFQDYEAIIIDDGSTDGSGKICDAYARKYPQLRVYHQANRGLMMARKEGIVRARGKYCLFLDSDDYYDIHLLQAITGYLKKYKLDLLIFGKYILYQNKVCGSQPVEDKFKRVGKKEMLSRFMASDKYNAVYTKAIRRRLIITHLDDIYKSVNYTEDALQTVNFIIAADKIGVLNKRLYYYRIRKSSLIHQMSAKRIKETLDVESRILDFIKAEGCLTEADRIAFLKKTFNDYMDCIYRLSHVKISYKEHVAEMEELRTLPFVREMYTEEIRRGIAPYNRARALLLINKKYRMLIFVDQILLRIQNVMDMLRNRKGFL